MSISRPEIETRDDVVVVRPVGDVDMASSEVIQRLALEAISNSSRGMVIDLSETRYLDSAGVRLLFSLANRLQKSRQSLAVAVPPLALVRKILAIVDIEGAATVHETVEAAIDGIRLPAGG